MLPNRPAIVHCPICGDQQVPVRDITVRVLAQFEHFEYRFFCPSCQSIIPKPCSVKIADLLLVSGAPREDWNLPLEMAEPKCGLPISADDILNFALEIEETDEIVSRMLSETHPAIVPPDAIF